MKRIINLIKVDLITVNGNKKRLLTVLILMFLIFGVLGFITSPLVSIECPLLLGAFFVPSLFRNDIKYHNGNLFSILPVSRRDFVKARFILTLLLYAGVSALFYLLMLLALHLKLYLRIFDFRFDLIGLLVSSSDNAFTELGYFNLFYTAAFVIGLFMTGFMLCQFFRNRDAFHFGFRISMKGKKENAEQIRSVLIAFALIVLFVMFISGVLPIGPVTSFVFYLISVLAKAANGILLSILLLSAAFFQFCNRYVTAWLNYEKKEL